MVSPTVSRHSVFYEYVKSGFNAGQGIEFEHVNGGPLQICGTRQWLLLCQIKLHQLQMAPSSTSFFDVRSLLQLRTFIDIRSTLLHGCYQEAHADARMLRRHMVIVVISLSDKRRRSVKRGRRQRFDSKDSPSKRKPQISPPRSPPPTLNIQRSKVAPITIGPSAETMRPPPPSIQ